WLHCSKSICLPAAYSPAARYATRPAVAIASVGGCRSAVPARTPFFHRQPAGTATTGDPDSYVVYDHAGGTAAIIDPVLDYDPKSGNFVRQQQLTVAWIIETHAHADHLSSIPAVQRTFKSIFNLETEFATDGRQFDHLFADGDTVTIGKLTANIIAVPGHTPADIAIQIGDAVFVGDTLFMPDVGTARCDFPGGSAATLYRSIRHLLTLPDDTRLFMCHDYPPPTRAPQWQSTVAQQRQHN
uniref:Metallo-beta-lactamase domain-containing protein n=1 Tax=Hucho hucho TaxID=62062 RepID=A0A4W5LR27_9TELE